MTEITHTGIITAIKNNIISVEIIQKEACSNCALKDACSQTTRQHIVDVECDNPKDYKIGQNIEVLISGRQAFIASMYGYIFPLILVIFSLFLCFIFTKDEILSGLFSISILLPYYVLLWIFRNKLKENLIIKINTRNSL